jgi:hypothetical protein
MDVIRGGKLIPAVHDSDLQDATRTFARAANAFEAAMNAFTWLSVSFGEGRIAKPFR